MNQTMVIEENFKTNFWVFSASFIIVDAINRWIDNWVRNQIAR